MLLQTRAGIVDHGAGQEERQQGAARGGCRRARSRTIPSKRAVQQLPSGPRRNRTDGCARDHWAPPCWCGTLHCLRKHHVGSRRHSRCRAARQGILQYPTAERPCHVRQEIARAWLTTDRGSPMLEIWTVSTTLRIFLGNMSPASFSWTKLRAMSFVRRRLRP